MTEVAAKRKRGRPKKVTPTAQIPNGVFDALFTCEVVVLLDRSGSMSTIKDDMEGGFNQFVKDQQAIPGRCDFTLVQFDSLGIETVYEAKPVTDVPNLALYPRGNTPLLDALGETVTQVGGRIDRAPANQKTDKLVFLVITDGAENSSNRFSKTQVKSLIEERTQAGWEFVFLGANIDSFAEAGQLGFSASKVANYTPDSAGVISSYSSVSAGVIGLRSGNSNNMSFSDAQRGQMSGVLVVPNINGTNNLPATPFVVPNVTTGTTGTTTTTTTTIVPSATVVHKVKPKAEQK